MCSSLTFFFTAHNGLFPCRCEKSVSWSIVHGRTGKPKNHLNHQPFISVWKGCICQSIPSRLRGVRAVRANATATTNSRVEEGMWTWCNGGCWHCCWDAQAVRQIAEREMRRVGAAYRTISRLDDRLIENAEERGQEPAGAGQDYLPSCCVG